MLIRDFAQRTLKNLDAIEAALKNDPTAEVYEVTQLINSLLGLIVFPKERYVDAIPRIPIEELRKDGWLIPQMKSTSPNIAADLHDLVRCLRNGISHCNLEFTSDGHQLTGLHIWNYPRNSRTPNWDARLGLYELRQFARKFIDLLLKVEQ